MRYLIILLVLVSCQNKTKTSTANTSIKACSDTVKYTNLILKSVNLPELQQYYKVQDNFNQKELVILNDNEHLNNIKDLNKFDKPIKLLSSDKIEQDGIKAYLEYKEINIKNDTAKIYYRYDIQGIGIKSSYFLRDSEWHLIESDLWEN